MSPCLASGAGRHLDVRVFNPSARSNRGSSLAAVYRKHEQEKRRQYEQRLSSGSRTCKLYSTSHVYHQRAVSSCATWNVTNEIGYMYKWWTQFGASSSFLYLISRWRLLLESTLYICKQGRIDRGIDLKGPIYRLHVRSRYPVVALDKLEGRTVKLCFQ